MNGLEQVKAAIAEALHKAGIATHTAYTPGWAKAYQEPVVAVGLRTGESKGGALGSYLGQRVDPTTMACREIYGMRLDLVLSLDIYCPPGEGAERCDDVLEGLHQVRRYFQRDQASLFSRRVMLLFFRAAVFLCRIPLLTALSTALTAVV